MTLYEFDAEVETLDMLFDNGDISQKEWALQYELLKDTYNEEFDKASQ